MSYQESGGGPGREPVSIQSDLEAFFLEDDLKTPHELLDHLVNEQQVGIRQRDFLPQDVSDSKEIVQWYKDSEYFEKLLARIDNYEREEEGFYSDQAELQGRVFADIAYAWLLARHHIGDLILTEDQTVRFFRRSYNNRADEQKKERRKVVKYPLSTGIEDISVPDGLIVGKSEQGTSVVKGIAEYTTFKTSEKFLRQASNWHRSARQIRKPDPNKPLLFERPPKFVFVVTHQLSQDVKDEVRAQFSHSKFSSIIHGHDIRDLSYSIRS